ncbi:hypothetical protein ACFVVU_10350 [Kitasatospora sp. NPDC057965]|uniref:hypothetical protein n=1 Tax=Kitasatospora sp. NPDC057965 TaxID=3346291 RepID=UPI0036DD846C
MTPLGLDVATWWWIALLATGVYLCVMVPHMPTPGYRVRTALAPVAMMLFGLASYAAKQMEPATVLAMYTSVVLVFPLGAVGHRRKLAQRLMAAKAAGESEDGTWPVAMVAQTFLACVVMITAYFLVKP